MRDLLITSGVHPSWVSALEPVHDDLALVLARLGSEQESGITVLPPRESILRVFFDPLENVKVLIVGQDPYPTAGHAMGLSFSVRPDVRPLPRSLQNIYKELHADLGIPPADHGDLSSWQRQGVMLMNRVLSVREGSAGSHQGIGWETVTDHAVRELVARNPGLISVLWGAKARTLEPILAGTRTIVSAHPSPLSASRGFFGSHPFSKINMLLRNDSRPEISWKL